MRNDLFSALRRPAFLAPASLFARFPAVSILVGIGFSSSPHCPASRAAANIQYTVILARVLDCVRLLPTLRADAIGKNYKSDGGAGSGSHISAGEPKCKGVRFSCERARAWLRPWLRGRRSLRPAPQCVGGWQRAGRRASIRFTAVSKPCVNAWGN